MDPEESSSPHHIETDADHQRSGVETESEKQIGQQENDQLPTSITGATDSTDIAVQSHDDSLPVVISRKRSATASTSSTVLTEGEEHALFGSDTDEDVAADSAGDLSPPMTTSTAATTGHHNVRSRQPRGIVHSGHNTSGTGMFDALLMQSNSTDTAAAITEEQRTDTQVAVETEQMEQQGESEVDKAGEGEKQTASDVESISNKQIPDRERGLIRRALSVCRRSQLVYVQLLRSSSTDSDIETTTITLTASERRHASEWWRRLVRLRFLEGLLLRLTTVLAINIDSSGESGAHGGVGSVTSTLLTVVTRMILDEAVEGTADNDDGSVEEDANHRSAAADEEEDANTDTADSDSSLPGCLLRKVLYLLDTATLLITWVACAWGFRPCVLSSSPRIRSSQGRSTTCSSSTTVSCKQLVKIIWRRDDQKIITDTYTSEDEDATPSDDENESVTFMPTMFPQEEFRDTAAAHDVEMNTDTVVNCTSDYILHDLDGMFFNLLASSTSNVAFGFGEGNLREPQQHIDQIPPLDARSNSSKKRPRSSNADDEAAAVVERHLHTALVLDAFCPQPQDYQQLQQQHSGATPSSSPQQQPSSNTTQTSMKPTVASETKKTMAEENFSIVQKIAAPFLGTLLVTLSRPWHSTNTNNTPCGVRREPPLPMAYYCTWTEPALPDCASLAVAQLVSPSPAVSSSCTLNKSLFSFAASTLALRCADQMGILLRVARLFSENAQLDGGVNVNGMVSVCENDDFVEDENFSILHFMDGVLHFYSVVLPTVHRAFDALGGRDVVSSAEIFRGEQPAPAKEGDDGTDDASSEAKDGGDVAATVAKEEVKEEAADQATGFGTSIFSSGGLQSSKGGRSTEEEEAEKKQKQSKKKKDHLVSLLSKLYTACLHVIPAEEKKVEEEEKNVDSVGDQDRQFKMMCANVAAGLSLCLKLLGYTCYCSNDGADKQVFAVCCEQGGTFMHVSTDKEPPQHQAHQVASTSFSIVTSIIRAYLFPSTYTTVLPLHPLGALWDAVKHVLNLKEKKKPEDAEVKEEGLTASSYLRMKHSHRKLRALVQELIEIETDGDALDFTALRHDLEEAQNAEASSEVAAATDDGNAPMPTGSAMATAAVASFPSPLSLLLGGCSGDDAVNVKQTDEKNAESDGQYDDAKTEWLINVLSAKHLGGVANDDGPADDLTGVTAATCWVDEIMGTRRPPLPKTTPIPPAILNAAKQQQPPPPRSHFNPQSKSHQFNQQQHQNQHQQQQHHTYSNQQHSQQQPQQKKHAVAGVAGMNRQPTPTGPGFNPAPVMPHVAPGFQNIPQTATTSSSGLLNVLATPFQPSHPQPSPQPGHHGSSSSMSNNVPPPLMNAPGSSGGAVLPGGGPMWSQSPNPNNSMMSGMNSSHSMNPMMNNGMGMNVGQQWGGGMMNGGTTPLQLPTAVPLHQPLYQQPQPQQQQQPLLQQPQGILGSGTVGVTSSGSGTQPQTPAMNPTVTARPAPAAPTPTTVQTNSKGEALTRGITQKGSSATTPAPQTPQQGRGAPTSPAPPVSVGTLPEDAGMTAKMKARAAKFGLAVTPTADPSPNPSTGSPKPQGTAPKHTNKGRGGGGGLAQSPLTLPANSTDFNNNSAQDGKKGKVGGGRGGGRGRGRGRGK